MHWTVVVVVPLLLRCCYSHSCCCNGCSVCLLDHRLCVVYSTRLLLPFQQPLCLRAHVVVATPVVAAAQPAAAVVSPSPSSGVAMLLLQPSDVCANTRLLLLRLMTCVSYRSCVISAWLLPAQPYPVPWCGVGCGGGATYPIIYLLIDLLIGV